MRHFSILGFDLVGGKRLSSCWRYAATLLILCALDPAGRARAKDYYVSPKGDDLNPGTASMMWRSPARVNAANLEPGDRVLFEAGGRFDGNLVLDERIKADPQRPIIIGSYGRGRAVIHAGLGTGILIRNLGGVVIRDLVVVGDDSSKNQGFGVMALNERGAARLDFIRIENVEASLFHWAGIYVGGVPALLPGFKEPPQSRFGFRDVLISHSIVHDNMYCGILVSGPWNKVPGGYANEDIRIRDCLVHDNLGDPSYLKHHSGDGILMDDTDGGLIDHCTAYHNGGSNGSRKGGPVGIWADAANRITIQFCESYANHTAGDTDGGGFDLDGGVSNSLVQYNYSHENDGAGFLVWNYKYAPHPLANNVIRYNVSENDGQKHFCGAVETGSENGKTKTFKIFSCGSVEVGSGQESPVHNIDVYNNTVITTKSGGQERPPVWVGGSSKNSAIHFRNNLLISAGGKPIVEVDKGQTGVLFQGNAYWTQGKPLIILYAGTEYHDLATWRAQTGQETFDGKEVGLFADPHLSRMGKGETLAGARRVSSLSSYRLLPGSPLIDAGMDLRADFGIDVGRRDLWGTPIPQGQGIDIGAFEARSRNEAKARVNPSAPRGY